jgi:hypothetical protein
MQLHAMARRGGRWSQVRRWLLALATVPAVGSAAGCASVPPCPAKGGPTWRALASEHFVLRTDLEVDDAIDTIRTLEETRSAMLAGFWGGDAGPIETTQVIVLASRGELTAFIGRDRAGLHRRHPPFPPLLVFSGAYRDGGSAAKHELAHLLSFHFLPIQPAWYAEGLAQFFQTAHYDRGLGRSLLGQPDQHLYQSFRNTSPLPLEQLLGGVPTDHFEVPRFYATSWLLVHYLMNHREKEFIHFRRRLGELEPAPQAFHAEFPDLDHDGLYRVLTTYLERGSYTVTSRTTPAWNGTPQIRVLSDTEVHGVRALLYATVSDREDQDTITSARGELDEALRASPPPIDALAVATYVPRLKYGIGRAELAARAVAADRGSWMAWMMTADAATTLDAASLGALIKAYELAPTNSEIGARLAIRKANEGHWPEALGFSNRVLSVGAQRPRFWLLHLRALIETGHCPEAARWRAALASYLPAGQAEARDLATEAARPCKGAPSDVGLDGPVP